MQVTRIYNSVDEITVGSLVSEFINVAKARYEVKKEQITLEGDKYDIFKGMDRQEMPYCSRSIVKRRAEKISATLFQKLMRYNRG